MWLRVDGLRAFSLGSPGPMRGRLTALALNGNKVATGDLPQRENVNQAEDVERVGEVQVLLGPGWACSASRDHTSRYTSLRRRTWEFAHDEGEGSTSIEDWREGHRSYYEQERVIVSDDSLFVCVWFRIAADPRRPA